MGQRPSLTCQKLVLSRRPRRPADFCGGWTVEEVRPSALNVVNLVNTAFRGFDSGEVTIAKRTSRDAQSPPSARLRTAWSSEGFQTSTTPRSSATLGLAFLASSTTLGLAFLNLQDVAPTAEREAQWSETIGSVQRKACRRHGGFAAGQRQRSSTRPQNCSHSTKLSRTLLW